MSPKAKVERRKGKDMHECPFCGFVCDCDIDDTWDLPIPDDCPHFCEGDVYQDDLDDLESE
jgi:hypothetical protein